MTVDYHWWAKMAKWPVNEKIQKSPTIHYEIKGKFDQLPWFNAKISTVIGADSAQRLWLSLETSGVPAHWAL